MWNFFAGERNVLDAEDQMESEDSAPSPDEKTSSGPALWEPTTQKGSVNSEAAPKPVGMYPHARKVGDLLYLSGVGPRQPGTNAIPGGPIHDDAGNPLDYDIKAQTRAVIDNITRILEEAGGSIADVLDVTSFLVDMDRDFAGYNEVWAGHTRKSRTNQDHTGHSSPSDPDSGRNEGHRTGSDNRMSYRFPVRCVGICSTRL